MTTSQYQQGVNFLKAGELDKAEQCFRTTLQDDPQNVEKLNALIRTLTMQKDNRWQEALGLMKKVIALAPHNADFQVNVGVAYNVLGNFPQAAQYFRKALTLAPSNAKAYFHLADTQRFETGDPIFEQLQTTISNSELSKEERSFLHFAAGKVHDDIGEYDQAFEHFHQANQLHQASFNRDAFIKWVDRIIGAFSIDLLRNKRDRGFAAHRPIFVMGMLRSGTTLVEQILSSHPRVAGAGELPDIESIARAIPQHHPDKLSYPEYIATLDPSLLSGFGEAYLRRVGAIFPTADRIVDKMPQNFFYLGLTRLLFPNATIIHCKRHPYDTCLSCYFKRFRRGQEFSFSLENLALYYRQYERIMEHWAQCDLNIYTVEYEQLIADPETIVRNLLSHANLEWNDACLDFHKTKRSVETASNRQVRQPLYKTSLARWQRYKKHLGPLMEGLPLPS